MPEFPPCPMCGKYVRSVAYGNITRLECYYCPWKEELPMTEAMGSLCPDTSEVKIGTIAKRNVYKKVKLLPSGVKSNLEVPSGVQLRKLKRMQKYHLHPIKEGEKK